MSKETTRDRILEQTVQLIREKGYHNIPLRQLTAMLGVTTGAFYRAFKDKEDLYHQLSLLEANRQVERWEESYLDKIESPLDGIWYIGLFLLSEYESNTQMMTFLYFNPVSIEAYKRGEMLPIGARALAYLDQLGITETEERHQLLVKLNAFIIGYGHLIANGLESFDVAVYRSAFKELLGGHYHD